LIVLAFLLIVFSKSSGLENELESYLNIIEEPSDSINDDDRNSEPDVDDDENQSNPIDESNFSRDYENYCKLSLNEMIVEMSDKNYVNEILKAYYDDDLLFECDVPKNLIKSNYTWIVNNKTADIIDSSYNTNIDKNIHKDVAFLKVACKFLTKDNSVILIKFPLIEIDGFMFKSEINNLDYFIKYKYQRLLSILKINFLITIVTVSLFLVFSTILYIKAKNNTKQTDDYQTVPV
jgi:hypothetical protein